MINLERNAPIPAPVSTDPSLRILIVAHGYPPTQIAGAEQQMQRKANWWHNNGHHVRVVAADPRLSNEFPFGRIEARLEQVDGVPVHRLRFAVADRSRPLVETYRHPLLASELRSQVQEFQPDFIYQLSGTLFGLLPIDIAAEYGIPSVLFATDFWHQCQRHTLLHPDGDCCPGPRHPSDCAACRLTARRQFAVAGQVPRRISWKLLAASGRQAERLLGIRTRGVREFERRDAAVADALDNVGLVVCNSRFLTNMFIKLGVSEDRILTIRQGIDAIPAPARATRPHTDSRLRILYLGQVTHHKGVDLLVRATSTLIDQGLDLELRIHGPVTDGAFSVKDRKSGRIMLGASLTRQEVVQSLAESDLLVVPSRWYENSPNVILEAQMMGVPVVTSDHGGMAEMVRHGIDGLRFEPGDESELREALRILALDRDFLNQLAANIVKPHPVEIEMRAEDQALGRLLAGRLLTSIVN